MSAFTTHLSKYYNDTVHWAFSSKVKDKELASNDDGNVIVTLDSEGGMSFEMPASVDDIISFMKGMKLRYNDGNGIRDIVTFLGVDYIDDMQMVCHIQRSDGTEQFTVPEISTSLGIRTLLLFLKQMKNTMTSATIWTHRI